ncbi:MAG: thioesterase [Magnetococcales bacterium]|nr:thioesterase [Magnetococcales bacterium]
MTQLFCLPYAGGNAYAFLGLGKHVDDFIRTVPLEPPGRGRRGQEPLLTSIEAITEDLANLIRGCLEGPYALIGHSLGAYLANLVIRRLIDLGVETPRHLFVSGAAGPTRPKKSKLIHGLSKEAFLAEVSQYGGLPQQVLAHQELIDYFEPILRADFQAVETHHYQPSDPLPVPITALTGAKDSIVTLDLVRLWQAETRHPLTIEHFPGDHFFIFEAWPRIGEIVSKTLMEG